MSDTKSSAGEGSSTPGETAEQPPQPAADPADEHLATVRLASLPPMPRPPASRSPLAPPSGPPPMGRNGASPEGAQATPGEWRLPPQKSSWLHSLLTSTLPPSGGTQSLSVVESIRRAPAAWVCALAALGLIVSALFIGLGAPPVETSLASDVVAAVVIARALMALGMVAIGLTLLRMSERWLRAGRGDRD
jgi:hypothetical protein